MTQKRICRLTCDEDEDVGVEAREFLNGYRNAYRARRVKLEEIRELEERIALVRSMDYTAERVKASPRGDAIPAAVAEMIDAQEEFISLEREATETQRKVAQVIEQVEDAQEREALHWRYVMCRRCEEIAEKMFISERQIYRLLAMGEIHVDEILNMNANENCSSGKNVSECHV